MADAPLLGMSGVTKSFGSVVALRDGSLELFPGSIHALVGENGAGKSTLVKIIAGVHGRDSGRVELAGQPVAFRSTAESRAAGIAVIYQEPTLFPHLTVTENIFMGRQPTRRFGVIDRQAMRTEAESLMARLGVGLEVDRLADGLSIADQQIIEIAKAISLDARVLIMDEPTAALSGVEVERLFAVARSLRDEGRALLFISHRFDEVFELTDTITVMRDGSHVMTVPTAATSTEEIVRAMVGRDVTELFPKQPAELGEVVLEVEGLSRAGMFSGITLQVRRGEIVALAGLVGAGRSEVARAIFGIDPYDHGSVIVAGHDLPASSPAAAMAMGLALVPEDRRGQGLVLEAPVGTNITDAIRRRLARWGFITTGRENRVARRWAGRLQVRTAALDTLAGTLSGGNQQKVVLAKWLATEPSVLIIDEPTRGIDVGTKSEVHQMLSDLAGRGMAILMISSELPEVLGMADRVLVMREGELTANLSRAEATPEAVMSAATRTEVAA
ncbi:MAG: sugar ABC transporter ATP-binding protein [Propionibacteriaceae bacterium]|nr:sugar ABC transporter ATP-binding protein [Propionibacteriaceae bacterium]